MNPPVSVTLFPSRLVTTTFCAPRVGAMLGVTQVMLPWLTTLTDVAAVPPTVTVAPG